MHITAQSPRLRNDLYCVEWDVKLYYTIPLVLGPTLLFVRSTSLVSRSEGRGEFENYWSPVHGHWSVTQYMSLCSWTCVYVCVRWVEVIHFLCLWMNTGGWRVRARMHRSRRRAGLLHLLEKWRKGRNDHVNIWACPKSMNMHAETPRPRPSSSCAFDAACCRPIWYASFTQSSNKKLSYCWQTARRV